MNVFRHLSLDLKETQIKAEIKTCLTEERLISQFHNIILNQS